MTSGFSNKNVPTFGFVAHGLFMQSEFDFGALLPKAMLSQEIALSCEWQHCARSALWQPRRQDWLVREPGHLSTAHGAEGLLFESYCGSCCWLPAGALEQSPVRVLVSRGRSISTARFQHTVLHAFLPHVLTVAGEIMLHAAAVVLEGRAHLFTADSGRGKSTLAAGFAARGLTVLSDDIVRIAWRDSKPVLYPAYRGVRLRDNSFLLPEEQRSGRPGRFGLPKHRLTLQQDVDPMQAFPLASINVLGSSRFVTPRFERLRPLQALPELIAGSFLLGLPTAIRSQEALARCSRLLKAVPIYKLSYRRSARHFDLLLDAISESLPTLSSGPQRMQP